MQRPEVAYAVLAAATVLVLAWGASHRYAVGAILVWLLCYPITDSEKTAIRLDFLGMDLTSDRLGLLLLLPFVFQRLLAGFSTGVPLARGRPLLWLVAGYALAAEVALFYNLPNLGSREVLRESVKFALWVCLFWLAFDLSGQRDAKALFRGVVAFACYSAVVGLIQWTVDDRFLQVGVPDPLFNGIPRAKGLFDELEMQGYVLSIAAALVLLGPWRIWAKLAVCLLLAGGEAVTLLRQAWILFPLVLAAGLWMAGRVRLLLAGAALTALAAGLALAWSDRSLLRDIKEDRGSSETIASRVVLMKLGVRILPEQPFGIGNFFESPFYAREAHRDGVLFYEMQYSPTQKAATVPLIIHNGFLASFVKYGYAGGLLFAALCLQTLITLAKAPKGRSAAGAFGLLAIVVFILSNLSQDNSAPKVNVLLTWLLTGIALSRVRSASWWTGTARAGDGAASAGGRLVRQEAFPL